MSLKFDTSFQRELSTQTWTLYGIGMFVIILRTYARWRRARSIALLAVDDWLMMTLVPLFYTGLIVCLNVIASGGGSNLYPPEDFDTFSEEDIQERIKGSKIVVISEQCMLNVIWTLKACMLFMFARISATTSYRRWIQYLAIYVFLGWFAIQIVFFTACRPFKGYWGMPPPDSQCTTYEHYAMVQAVFNISSDLAMLMIPMPMLAKVSLPLRQKVILAGLFSMGGFVIIAAILTKVYNLQDVYSTVYMLWYTREASVAVYVANLPGVWPLLREHVKFLRSHASYPGSSATPLPQYGNVSTLHTGGRSGLRKSMRQGTVVALGSGAEDEIELGRASFSKGEGTARGSAGRSVRSHERRGSGPGAFGRKLEHMGIGTRRGSLDSDERVLNENGVGMLGSVGSTGGWGRAGLDVHVDTTIEVRRGNYDEKGEGDARFRWEVERQQPPKVRIEGPEGEVVDKA